MLKLSISTYVKTFPQIVAVSLVGSLPIQLAIALIVTSGDLQGGSLLQWQIQGLAGWVFGTLVIAATYITLHGSIVGELPRGLGGVIAVAYGRALKAWVGMFLTVMMVSFAVGVSSIPLLGAFLLVRAASPALQRFDGTPASLDALSPGDLAPLLLTAPLLLIPFVVFLRYLLADVVVALERVDGFQALERSRSLTEGQKGALALPLLVLGVPLQLASLSLLALSLTAGPWIAAAVNSLGSILSALLGAFLVQAFLALGGEARSEAVQPKGAEGA